MKLISCYVENFGALSQKRFEFNESLNEFCQENGAGKTTLSAFLKAMFYGLEPVRINTVGFLDRIHYYPFQAGRFGGYLTFEDGGFVYKIERFFDEKSGTKDTLRVFKDEKEIEMDDPAAVFLGVDKASFERTAFIGSGDISIEATGDIRAKLIGTA